MGRMESARIGLQCAFVVALRRSRSATTMGVLNFLFLNFLLNLPYFDVILQLFATRFWRDSVPTGRMAVCNVDPAASGVGGEEALL